MLFKDLIIGQRFLISYEIKESSNKKSATWLPVIFWCRKTGTNAYERDSVYKLLRSDYKISWKSKFAGFIYDGAEVTING